MNTQSINVEHIHKFVIVSKVEDGWDDIEEYHLLCECGEMRIVDVQELKKLKVDK